MSRDPREPGVIIADRDTDAGDLSRQDPLLKLLRNIPRAVWYGLAALALVAVLVSIGVAWGVSMQSGQGTPSVEQGLVTWVNVGLPPPKGGGGPAEFLARVAGQPRATAFELSDTAGWYTAGSTGWYSGTMPSCLVPRHGRTARFGFGAVHVRIRFGVVHVAMSGSADVVVWVECL